jgi:uncharacterized membrane protein YfhO
LIEDLADEGNRVSVRDSRANKVTVELEALPGPRALVFTEINFPGWRATLDGEPVTMLEANGIYKAVIVPAGTHEVVFEYRPRSVYVGAAISVSAFVTALGLALFLLLGRQRRKAEDAPTSAVEPTE